jgi:galactose mutarotase-like enzyme
MPGGIGFHPWFRRPVRVAIAAEFVHPSNLATEPLPVPVSGDLDRRRLEELPEGVDATWSDIGDPPVVLLWPDIGLRATMTADVLNGPTLFIVAARLPGTDAVAVEPQTHAPDGLRRLALGEPGAVSLIPPGESIELAVVLAFERSALDPDTEDQT